MKLFDLHCDTLYRAYTEKSTLFNDSFHISFNKAKKIRPYIQCLAVWIPDEYRSRAAVDLFKGCVQKLHSELDAADVQIISTKEQLAAAKESGTGAILTVEGGAVLDGRLENISMLRDAGVKMMTLTWNGTNELGDGVGVENAGGITAFGKAAVAEMERQNIIVDISHASQRLFYDVAELAAKPFVASHSDSMSVTPHKRNLTDEQFGIIREKQGLVGLNFCVDFLNKQGTNAKMYDIIKNAEHFLSLGGEKTLAIGGDFDGADIPADMSGIETMPALYEMFLHHNYSESLVEDIFFNNAFRFFSKALEN